MKQRTDLWTILIVTAVTVLIWYWAAGETRVERTMPIRLEFEVTDGVPWQLQPRSLSIAVVAEGSQRAIRQAEQLRTIAVPLPANKGRQTIDVFETIRSHPDLIATGVTVVSTDRSAAEIDLDQIVVAPGRVVLQPTPGLSTRDTPEITPGQVEVRVPSRLMRAGQPVTVNAVVDQYRLAGLEPGIRHVLENVPVRLPDRLAANPTVTVEPSLVTVAFTLRSLVRDVTPPVAVRVQVAGSPEDDYEIAIEPKQLRDVVITAPEDVARQIEAGEVTVFAIVYLKSREKEARITRKPVSFFIALQPDGHGVVVDARVAGSTTPPEISLTIEERSEP